MLRKTLGEKETEITQQKQENCRQRIQQTKQQEDKEKMMKKLTNNYQTQLKFKVGHY